MFPDFPFEQIGKDIVHYPLKQQSMFFPEEKWNYLWNKNVQLVMF